MVVINNEKCIGCGACVLDCFRNNIIIQNGKAETLFNDCMMCGHCVAVCPENAVIIDNYDMNEVIEVENNLPVITSDNLMKFIKRRRSVRHFKNEHVEHEKILKIIDAGRFAPTAGNRQGNSFIVVEDKMKEFRVMALEALGNIAENILSSKGTDMALNTYAQRWKFIYNQYKKNPDAKDTLFFDVPTAILLLGDTQLDVGIAASNMELMAHAQDLGVLYSGFITRACYKNKEIKELVGIKDNQEVVTVLLVGYPDIKFLRTVPRKDRNVIWN